MTPPDFSTLADGAEARDLDLLGGFHSGAAETLILLGPAGPDFWEAFADSPEMADRTPDPMDRWSHRVIGDWASELGAMAHFPDDRPFPPFYDWALRCGTCHPSPILMLVHERAGLMVSFRGALRLPWLLELPAPAQPPCDGCAQPCLTTCPVGALTTDGYDVDACVGWITTPEGSDCRARGCAARRACPVSRGWPRDTRQSAFHMDAFLAAHGWPRSGDQG